LIIHTQWEDIGIRRSFPLAYRRHENHGTRHIDENGRIGLSCNFAVLQGDLVLAVLELFPDWIHKITFR
jgi:hypothetical protein